MSKLLIFACFEDETRDQFMKLFKVIAVHGDNWYNAYQQGALEAEYNGAELDENGLPVEDQ